MSLGKLGGNELNYSSDIDLMFIYDDGDRAAGAANLDREYFVRLSQQTTELLSRVTKEGRRSADRPSTCVRRAGKEPAVGLRMHWTTDERRASDWELQAMIKVRHSGRGSGLGREFIQRSSP